MKVIVMLMNDAARLNQGESFTHKGIPYIADRIKYDFCPYSQRFVAAVHVVPATFLKREEPAFVLS